MSLSDRVSELVKELMPKIAVQIAQRSSAEPFIDMGTAENWLIREEVIRFFYYSIRNHISVEVCH